MQKNMKTIVIAISGGSGSGKTTAAKMLRNELGAHQCRILSQDSYYKDQSREFKGDGTINFDHPKAIDFNLLEQHLQRLIEGKSIHVPVYDFITHSRKKETTHISNSKFIIIDGTLILYEAKIRQYFHTILFLDIPEEIRFARRLKRDVEERGRTPEGVQTQFYNLVKPMHDLYVAPSSIYADYVARDTNEVQNAVQQIASQLRKSY